jgi:DNA-binding NarL/FixJ family response regulator
MLASMALRIIIVDDNAAFLRASRVLLEGQGASVVGVATTAADGLRLVGAIEADVILVDIDLGDESGFDVARRLASASHEVAARIVMISTYPEDDFADLIAASPVAGFVAKSYLSTQSIEAVLSDGKGG